MFTIEEKINSVLNQIKEIEGSLRAAYDCRTPNVYSHSLKLKIEILNNVLVLYTKTSLENKKAPENELIYNIENEL